MKKKSVLTFLLLLLSFFAFFYFYKLTEIGPEYDESLFVNAALGCPNPKMFLHLSYPLGTSCLPVMVMPYQGATQAYFLRLGFGLFGTSLFTMRFVNFLLTLLSFLLIFSGVKKTLGTKTALITILLLVMNPQFLLNARYDRTYIAPLVVRSTAIFVAFYSSPKFNKIKYLLLGFLIGFSIFTKLDGIFLVISLIAAGLVMTMLHKKWSSKLIKKGDNIKKIGIQFIAGGIVGVSPLAIYAKTSWQNILAAIRVTSVEGIVADGLIQRKVLRLLSQFSSNQLSNMIFRQDIIQKEVLVLSSFVFIVFTYILIKSWNNKGLITYFVITCVVFYLLLFLYRDLSAPHHIMLIYPIPQIIVANYLAPAKRASLLTVLIVILLASFLLSYHGFQKLSSFTCGRTNWSCTIREIPKHLTINKPVIAGDWGLATQILLLTKGKKEINEYIFEADQSSPELVRAKMNIFKKNCHEFVIFTPEFTRFLVGAEEIRKNVNKDPRYYKTIIQNRERQDFIEIYKCK